MILPIPSATLVAHGEGAGPAGVESWAVGIHDGAIVYVSLAGYGYKECAGVWSEMGRVVDATPELPADDNDVPGWEAWAAAIRDRINKAEPVQQTLFT